MGSGVCVRREFEVERRWVVMSGIFVYMIVCIFIDWCGVLFGFWVEEGSKK